MEKKNMKHYKYLLDHHKEDHEGIIDDMEGITLGENDNFNSSELSKYDNHPADIGTEVFEEEHLMGLKKLQEYEVEEIKHAKERIDNGSYGLCENCGKEIDNKRLEVLPQARFCIDCARKQDDILQDTKGITMNKRPSEEQVVDAINMNIDGVQNQALEDVMHYGSSSDID